MIRIRYMLVDHPRELDGQLHVLDGKFQNGPPMHHLCPVHHWERMDDSTIFVKAHYHDQYHPLLMAMAEVTVLPATFSRQTVVSAIQQQATHHHKECLTCHPIPFDDSTVTSDLVDWMTEYRNRIFGHEI